MKTYQQLEISEREYNALQEVREGLATGRFKHCEEFSEEEDNGNAFSLEIPCSSGRCGTVACIGGWTWITVNSHRLHLDDTGFYKLSPRDEREAILYVDSAKGELYKLFFPNHIESYNSVTAAQAVRAINNYLETGHAKWHEVVPASQD